MMNLQALWQYLQAGGPLMIPLAILSFASWYWVLILVWRLRRRSSSAAELEACLRGDGLPSLPEAVERWASERRDAAARVARHAAAGRIDAASLRSRAAEARLAEVGPFRIDLSILKALVAAAPLLGLLGTVRGMVGLFSVLAARGTASASHLAAGISEAIVTTQVGLVVALPGIVGAYIISRRIDELETDLLLLEASLVTRLARTAGGAEGSAP